LLLAAGYGSILLAGIPWLGPSSAALTRFAFAAIRRVAELIDTLPASPWHVAPPPAWVLVALAVAGLTATLASSVALRRPAGLAFALLTVSVHLGPPPERPAAPTAELLDVGQGQALVWKHGGRVTLVDAGGRGYGRWDPGARVVRPALLAAGLRRIDRLILSHGDADHAAGAFAILDAFEVGELWLGPGWWRDARLHDLAARATRRGAALRMVWRGFETSEFRVVSPSRDGPATSDNAGSIALVIGHPPSNLFVPGDLDGIALERALDAGWIEPSTAAVLAHHGSRHGTPARLLERLDPAVALVSCGWRNRFGHPHRESRQRLRERGIPLWRTDHHGTIRLRAKPSGWEVAISPRTSRGTR